MGVSHRKQTGGLDVAQEKTKAVEVEILRASDHAAVIGTVLGQQLPDDVQVGDVARAIEQTEDLAQKLAESAATLANVSAELGREIKMRCEVAKELDKSEARVARLSGAKKEQERALNF